MPPGGEIVLGYSRSAGTADQAIAGVVTARRDRDQMKRQKLLKQQAVEDAAVEKKRQDLAARFMKMQWREQDREKKRKRKDASEDSSERHKKKRSKDSSEERRKRKRSRRRKKASSSSEKPTKKSKKKAEKAEKAAKAEEKSAKATKPEEEEHEDEPQATGLAESLLLKALEPPRPAAPTLPTPMDFDARAESRRGPAPERPALAQATTVLQPKSLQRAKASASMLGFGIDDDDDRERKERELAERMRARRSITAASQAALERSAGARGLPSSVQVDAHRQLKQLADWKRSCRGSRRPMPKDMEEEIGSFAALQGLQ